MSSAAGVVVLSEDGEKVIIVLQDKTNYGFPKGGRKKNETIEVAACRELEEETGLKKSRISIVSGGSSSSKVEERNAKGNVCVTYLVATTNFDSDSADAKEEHKFTFDEKEIDEVKWMTIPEALSVLIPRRGKVLLEARSLVASGAKPITPTKRVSTNPVLTAEGEEKRRAVWLSKTMSWALRHKLNDEKYDLKPSAEGYVALERLMSLSEMQPRSPSKEEKPVTVEEIKSIVATNDKQRFKLMETDGVLFIRANQGHSVPSASSSNSSSSGAEVKVVTLNDEKMMKKIIKPLPICIHGTTKSALKKILSDDEGVRGLRPVGRVHIHFAAGHDVVSGMRKDCPVKIFLDMEKAMGDGIEFFLSDNGVILSRGAKSGVILPEYFLRVEDGSKVI